MASHISVCPLCEHPLHLEWENARLSVRICRHCGHRLARHAPQTPERADYHEQYEQNRFVESLEETRRRQARQILDAFSSVAGRPASWMDFGCGRGWFLEEAQRHGVPSLVGVDASALAIQWLHERGIRAVRALDTGTGFTVEWPQEPVASQVISFLDVLEHFGAAEFLASIRSILDHIPKTAWVVIKVPVSSGIFFRIADLLRRIGVPRPLERLYQVGTRPAHQHYFSHRSLDILLERLSLKARRVLDDPDFDRFSDRLQFRWKLPPPAQSLLNVLALALSRFGGKDTRIVIAASGTVVS